MRAGRAAVARPNDAVVFTPAGLIAAAVPYVDSCVWLKTLKAWTPSLNEARSLTLTVFVIVASQFAKPGPTSSPRPALPIPPTGGSVTAAVLKSVPGTVGVACRSPTTWQRRVSLTDPVISAPVLLV